MTWKSRLALPECNRPGCTEAKWSDKNFCEQHWKYARDATQLSMWRKRHSGVWTQQRLHIVTALNANGAVIHIVVAL